MKWILILLLGLGVTPLAAGNLWLLATGDTLDPILGRSALRDLASMEDFFSLAAQKTGLELQTRILKDSEASWTQWDKTLQSFNFSPGDVLVVYFSLDGRKNASTAWTDILMGKVGRNLYGLAEELKKKQPRLLLVIAETPQREEPQVKPRSSLIPLRSEENNLGWKNLFLKSKGNLILAAAESGEEALAFSEGGVLTVTFVETITRNILKKLPVTWGDILQEVQTLVKEDTHGRQNPMKISDIRMPPPGMVGPSP
ncbi:MAG: hypothetical protein A2Z96_02875 [Spirochaetes bacterium GWB1_48_6]|nr:MAG: hypothetical protein A2Z96_02875 [Spirochaetes bacterium GWB1_48_6]